METTGKDKEPLIISSTISTNPKGGFRTLPFIIGKETQTHLLESLIFMCACVCVCRTIPLCLCGNSFAFDLAANQAFEKTASFGILPNMILYLTRHYGMEAAAATNVIPLWSAASNFTPILGDFLADSYIGRYPTIAFGSLVTLLVGANLITKLKGTFNFVFIFT